MIQNNSDSTDLHVVTENGEQCFMWRSNQLTYIAQDRRELPLVLANKFGALATKLDLSYNTLNSYKNINHFTNLSELILDNNCFEDNQLDFRQNLRLKTLSLNKNKLKDLHALVNSIKKCFPNLEYLSLIGNPLWPSPIPNNYINNENDSISDGTCKRLSEGLHSIEPATTNGHGSSFVVEAQLLADNKNGIVHLELDDQHHHFAYQKYRNFIIYHLPNLRFLDSSPISGQERNEALRRCFWMAENSTSKSNYSASTNGSTYEPSQASSNGPGASFNQEQQGFQLTIMSDYVDGQQQPKGAFSRLAYRYTGKHSEGNRFIRNHDL